jgi:hypothetical protein
MQTDIALDDSRTTHSRVPVGATATAVAFGSFFGLRRIVDHSGADSWALPLVLACVVALGLFSLWEFYFARFCRLRQPERRASAVALALGTTLSTIAVSSWPVTVSLSGTAALVKHMSVTLEMFKARVRDAKANADLEAMLLPELRTHAAAIAGWAAGEEAGALSTQAGNGPVARSLQALSDQLAGVASTLGQASERVDLAHREAGEILGRMQALLAANIDIEERQKRFAVEAVRLQEQLNAMQRGEIANAVRDSTVGGILRITVSLDHLSGSQRDVLRKVEAEVDDWGHRLRERAKQILDARRPVEPVAYEPLNPGMATIRYYESVLPAWAVAVAIDLIPLLFFLASMLMAAEEAQIGPRAAGPRAVPA